MRFKSSESEDTAFSSIITLNDVRCDGDTVVSMDEGVVLLVIMRYSSFAR